MTANRFTGTHMLLCIFGFFGVIIAVNITLAVFATSTWTGLVAKNGYVTSQAYNGVLEGARKQAALGWSSQLDLKDGRLDFSLSDRNGNALTGFEVDAKISRPIHELDDLAVKFVADADGQYSATAELKAGQWDVDLVASNSKGETYRRIFRLWVEPAT